MVMPCIVYTWLYTSADRTLLLGVASWMRISSASMPPRRKKMNAPTPYMMPIRL